jgi:fructose-1,6-bisphosphatase
MSKGKGPRLLICNEFDVCVLIQNAIFKSAVAGSGQVRAMASEEEDGVLLTDTPAGRYAVVFDPLDGSRNIDAAIPTGTIFGVYLCSAPPASDSGDMVDWCVLSQEGQGSSHASCMY